MSISNSGSSIIEDLKFILDEQFRGDNEIIACFTDSGRIRITDVISIRNNRWMTCLGKNTEDEVQRILIDIEGVDCFVTTKSKNIPKKTCKDCGHEHE